MTRLTYLRFQSQSLNSRQSLSGFRAPTYGACSVRADLRREIRPAVAVQMAADQRPGVARGLLAQLGSRLRKANDVVADLVFSDVPGRVAKALLDLASRFGRTADDGVHVHHDLTQEELAQLVGASRETVNKALADFASRGWLRLEPRSVVILDVERLHRRAR